MDRAPEIELRIADMNDYAILAKIDLSFETEYVWRSQMIDGLDSYSVQFQKIRLPKIIPIPFQGYQGEALEKLIRRQEIMVARYDGAPVGFMRLEPDENGGRLILKSGGIMRDFRRKGIGSVMLKRLQEIAHQNGIPYLVSIVQAKNDPAIRFLTARGFQLCGFEEFYFPNMEIALFFSKNIR